MREIKDMVVKIRQEVKLVRDCHGKYKILLAMTQVINLGKEYGI
jgi:hypothetical protein